jgi:hypothetical protein
MINSLFQLLIICTFQLSNYSHDRHRLIEVQVEPYKSLSYGAFFKSLVLKTQPENVEYIEGFDFEWGYTYKLKVEEIQLETPPQDGSSVEYKFIKLLSKTKAEDGYSFRLNLESEVYLGGDHANSFEQINDSTFVYFNEINISVPSEHLSQFKLITKSRDNQPALFSFIDSKTLRFIKFL